MHPFGGTHCCPRCSKLVYAAEQVMGPGRKLYHKPCLACMICNKRLDSYTLLEHDQMPYCKSCHVKNFANRDLRQANLPHYDITPSTSPPSPSPIRSSEESEGVAALRLRPDRPRAASPVSSLPPTGPDSPLVNGQDVNDDGELLNTVDESSVSYTASYSPPLDTLGISVPTNTGRPGFGGIPRTVSLSPTRGSGASSHSRHHQNNSVGSSTPKIGINRFPGTPPPGGETQRHMEVMRPLVQTSTGTRYGTALGGGVGTQVTGGGSPRRWGTGTPSCPRCGKSVYFAEQVKAVGKTYHKGCLRCTECNTLLDSSRLRDHDGDPLCVRCYGKLHGPQGAGYALLGKAGG